MDAPEMDLEREQRLRDDVDVARMRIIFCAGMVCFAHVAVAHTRTALVLAVSTAIAWLVTELAARRR